MMLGRALLGWTLLLSTALVARADGISAGDPKIIVGRGTGSMPVTALQFKVPIDAGGGGIVNFDNETGQDWVGLILTVTFPNAVAAKAAAFSCSNDLLTSVFSACSSERHGKILTITLTKGEITPCSGTSCSMDSEFFVDLNNGATLHDHGKKNGNGGWKGDAIVGQAITTPEPTTLPFLLSGLGGIWLWRKRG